jgi:hypothetical protein
MPPNRKAFSRKARRRRVCFQEHGLSASIHEPDGLGRVPKPGWYEENSLRIRYRYSILRASMGEMEAARFAGMMAAKNEQIARAPAATPRASGSHEETPYSWAEIKRPAPTARGKPRIKPAKTRLNAPRRTS